MNIQFNTPIKIRFQDASEIIITIFEKEKVKYLPWFQVWKEAPLGRALLGHKIGEKIEYRVGNITHQVTITDIYNT